MPSISTNHDYNTRNYFGREEITTWKSIQKETTNMSYTHAATTINQCMTTNITCVLGTTTYLIISIHNISKNNGKTERNYFDQVETSKYKSIQKGNTNIYYTHAATTINACITSNTTCILGTTDYLIISINNENKTMVRQRGILLVEKKQGLES